MTSVAMPRKALKIATWITVVVAAIPLCVAVYFHFANGPTEFDRQIWLNGEQADFSEDAPRLRMADGLVQDGKLMGMTRAQVDALLGPQTNTTYFRPEYTYVYWLGAERGFMSIDSEWLVLKLADGKISQAHIVHD